MSTKPPYEMTPEEVRAYRAGVEALVVACLEQVRRYPVGRDTDPAPERPRQ